MLRGVWVRIRALVGRQAADDEVREELRYHLDAEAARNVAAGMAPSDAATAARRAVGNLTVARAEAREALAWRWLDVLTRDTRFAWRSLKRSPGFAAIAVLSLGVAIALGTTTFSMLSAIVRPYTPVEKPEQLAVIEVAVNGRVYPGMYPDLSLALASAAGLPWRIVPMGTADARVDTPDGTLDLDVAVVGADFFTEMGAHPLAGRVFTANDTAGRPSPVVIGFALWTTHFNRDRRLGRLSVPLADGPHPVVGVMPPEMVSWVFGPGTGPDVYEIMPSPISRFITEPYSRISGLVRLGPGDSRHRVSEALQPTVRRVAALYPSPDHRMNYHVAAFADPPAPLLSMHLALGGAALLVLLVGSLNLANLMMARSLARRREFALRLAIGAGRAAIARTVLAECGMLAVAGGVAGTVLSVWGVHLLEFNMPQQLVDFGFIRPHLGWPVIAVGVVITLVAVVVSGLVPALRAHDGDAADAMKDGGAGATGRSNRWYRALAVAEVGGALVLVTASGLLTRAAIRISRTPLAYDARHLYSVWVYDWKSGCPPGDSTSLFYDDLARKLERIPGIRYVAATARGQVAQHIMTSDQSGGPFQRPMTGYTIATPDFFRTLGVPIVAGRDFEPGDLEAGGVAIVNQYTATRFWPFESAVGRALKLGPSASNAPWVRVVGVSRQPSNRGDGDGAIGWVPDVVVAGTGGCVEHDVKVRVSKDDPRNPVLVTRALAGALPAGGYSRYVRWEMSGQQTDLSKRSFMAWIFIALGGFVLLLAVVGVYGVLSYVVGQRMREFATRVALGASSRDLLRLVLRDGLIMVLGGVGVGAFFAMAFGQLFDFEWLNRIPGSDVVALFGAELIVVAVSLAACIAPAVRAARANPVDVLRAI